MQTYVLLIIELEFESFLELDFLKINEEITIFFHRYIYLLEGKKFYLNVPYIL